MTRDKESVPQVGSEQLQEAFALVAGWVAMEDESDAEKVMVGRELSDLLDAICDKLDVDKASAIALFKRALALVALCDDESLPDRYFDGGYPADSLYSAAARARVLDVEGGQGGTAGHGFDMDEIAALMETRN